MDKYRKVMKPKETALGLLGAKPALGTLGWSSFEPNMFEKKTNQVEAGWWFQRCFIVHFIKKDAILPIDELAPSFFKMGTLHHQEVINEGWLMIIKG
jgi:hypothetical protein